MNFPKALDSLLIETERLVLRPLQDSDAEALQRLRSDERVNQYLDRPASITIEYALEFIHRIQRNTAENDCFYWAIALKSDPTLIGTVCFWNLVPEKNQAELGYELYTPFHGKGIMMEAVNAVLKTGFESLDFELITATPVYLNEDSVKLLLRNGFEFFEDAGQFLSEEEIQVGMVVYLLDKSRYLAQQ
jgi:ribosomal-protein-alanine N-acetyltransferase